MKRFWWWFLATLVLGMLVVSALYAQTDSSGTKLFGVPVPEGFNIAYIGIFAIGMLVHYMIVVFKKFGKDGIWDNLVNNFVAWFANQFHKTALATAGVAILTIGQEYFTNIAFGTINSIAIVISLGAGYIGDSMFNAGTLVQYHIKAVGDVPTIPPIIDQSTPSGQQK